MPLHIALFEPEIPPNTGNIIRLCANTGASLHLIHPLGFALDDKRMRRAGLDYLEWATITEHQNFAQFAEAMQGRRIFSCTTKASRFYHEISYQNEDCLLFGPESRGLPTNIREQHTGIKIPMRPESRSLNLSNAVAIILFEAYRQLDFAFED